MKSGPDRAEMLRSRLNHQYPDYFAPNLSCQVYFGGVVCGKAHQVDNEWTPFCFPACFWRAKLSNARMNLTPVPRGIVFTWKKSTPLRRATRPEETGCPAEWGTPPRMWTQPDKQQRIYGDAGNPTKPGYPRHPGYPTSMWTGPYIWENQISSIDNWHC